MFPGVENLFPITGRMLVD